MKRRKNKGKEEWKRKRYGQEREKDRCRERRREEKGVENGRERETPPQLVGCAVHTFSHDEPQHPHNARYLLCIIGQQY